MSGVSPVGGKFRKARGHARRWALLALMMPAASCVPSTAGVPLLDMAAEPAAAPALSLPFAAVMPDAAATTNAILAALTGASAAPAGTNPAAGSYVFQGRTPIDQMRSLDCLAQAVYYEARSESEDGQRAVAQVVINRVRHPAWPNSVCGVVYQGPMRPGGGCQFTFTCDGSLAVRPSGYGWDQARRIAAEALAGQTYAPVGLSTHYHTNAVSPSWGPRLIQTTNIGAHIFYRLPGAIGTPGAFNAVYAGSEPVPRPAAYLPFGRAGGMPVDRAAFALASASNLRAAVTVPSDI
ncbi:MAG TPA: cell wall hydrolase, partial [Allosphingosinicella sp.]